MKELRMLSGFGIPESSLALVIQCFIWFRVITDQFTILQEYAHPEIALRGGDKEAGSGNEEKVDEPNMEIGAGMNPAEPSGGLGGQLEDTTPGVGEEKKCTS